MYAIGVYGWPGWDATFGQSPLMLFGTYPRVELDSDLVLDVTAVERQSVLSRSQGALEYQ